MLLRGYRAYEIARLNKKERTVSHNRKNNKHKFVFFKGERTRQKQEVLFFLHPARFSMESQVCASITMREETKVILPSNFF